MGVDHVFHRIRNDFAGGKRVQHAAVAHSDAVIDCNSVEFFCDTAGRVHRFGDNTAHVAEVNVSGYELCERVGDGDDWFAEVIVGHARCAP